MKAIITASGGGHTGYAVAIAQRLVGRAEVEFIIPRGDKWSRSKVEKFGYVYEVSKPRGPRDSFAKLLLGLPRAFYESFKYVKRADVFIATGSNHCVPPALIAKLRGIPLVSIESSVRFTKRSRSISFLSTFSEVVALQWEEQKELYPKGIVFGPMYELPEHEIADEGYILVTGGTYGFKQLFDLFIKTDFKKVVLQTGRVDPEPYRRAKPDWIVFDFDPDLGRWIARASVVVSHLGKTVIDAALTYRKPVVIVPNPEWKLTAGVEDAKILAQKLNAVVVEDLNLDKIIEAIDEARKRRPPSYPDGAKNLVEYILTHFVRR